MSVTPLRRGPGRPRSGETSVDRGALLAAAETLIRRVGAGVSLEAIAAEAGVSKPIVYHHVGGKDAVVQGLAWRLNERQIQATRSAVAGIREPSAAIRAFVDASLDQLEIDRNVYLYVSTTNPGSGGSDGVLAFADQSAADLARFLADLRGEKHHATALPWAYGVIGFLHFVALWWIRDSDRSRAELSAQLSDLLWSGLRGEP